VARKWWTLLAVSVATLRPPAGGPGHPDSNLTISARRKRFCVRPDYAHDRDSSKSCAGVIVARLNALHRSPVVTCGRASHRGWPN
jgi:hypothetical protein